MAAITLIRSYPLTPEGRSLILLLPLQTVVMKASYLVNNAAFSDSHCCILLFKKITKEFGRCLEPNALSPGVSLSALRVVFPEDLYSTSVFPMGQILPFEYSHLCFIYNFYFFSHSHENKNIKIEVAHSKHHS